MKPQTTVIATVEMPGFHRWPDAPEELSYLATPHRHQFRFRVECATDDPDRQVEFHVLRRWTLEAIMVLYKPAIAVGFEVDGVFFDGRSCETIAQEVGYLLRVSHPVVAVEVWEDRENGARVDWLSPPSGGPATKVD